ncbi:DUF5317 domain-containing protein [Candidatus Wolfebacteria bacterium]|nr:DUF5317 domain-containing protein [Candidatus Wolfebacteria bacterium]
MTKRDAARLLGIRFLLLFLIALFKEWILFTIFLIEFLGALSNIAVMLANYGYMPVLIKNEQIEISVQFSKKHSRMNERTRLRYLADIFYVKDGVISIGDYLIDIFYFLFKAYIIIIIVSYITGFLVWK